MTDANYSSLWWGWIYDQMMEDDLSCWMEDISRRISVQDLETFHYDHQFEAIFIPTNSFSHLATQEAQIRVLRSMYTHLAPRGRLLLDLRLAGMRDLVQAPEIQDGSWHTWTHPEAGRPIRQRIVGR